MTVASLPVGDRIGRLALLGWPECEPPPHLEGLTPPGVGERAILLVRRVVVVSEPWNVGESVQGELAEAARTAVRPHRGLVPPDSEAVLFADAAELLACYLLSLRRAGVAPEWVWAQVAGSLPPPEPAAVLRDPATPVSAVVAVLDGWDRLDEAVGGLDAAGALRVVEALAEQHGLWVRAVEAPDPPPAGSTYTSGESRPAALPAAPAWELGRLGSDVVLGVVVADDGFAASLGSLGRVLLGRDPGLPVVRPPSRAVVVSSGSTSPTRSPVTTGGSPGVPVAPPAEHEEREDPEAAAPTGADRVHLLQRQTGAPGRDAGIDAAGRVSAPPSAPAAPDAVRLEDEGVATGCGGVLYLVNPYRRLDLAAAGLVGLVQAAPWDVLEGLGREALGAVDALDDGDALWDVLAALAGRSAGKRPGPEVLDGCRAALDGIVADLALGPDEPRLGELLLVPGYLRVDHANLDLVAPLDAVHLSVRRRALDADPGWVPELGRVVRFHFVGGGSP